MYRSAPNVKPENLFHYFDGVVGTFWESVAVMKLRKGRDKTSWSLWDTTGLKLLRKYSFFIHGSNSCPVVVLACQIQLLNWRYYLYHSFWCSAGLFCKWSHEIHWYCNLWRTRVQFPSLHFNFFDYCRKWCTFLSYKQAVHTLLHALSPSLPGARHAVSNPM